jgi:hypothetical protein
MRRKWERTREMETIRRPSFHDGGGDSSQLTRFVFRLEHCKDLLLLTCAGVISDAISTTRRTNYPFPFSLCSPSQTTPLFSSHYCKYTLFTPHIPLIANVPFYSNKIDIFYNINFILLLGSNILFYM